MSDHMARRLDPPEGVQPHPADLARMLEGVEERRRQPAYTDTPEEIRAWLAAREAQDETSGDEPRFEGLPLEEYDRPAWFPLPDGFEYVDWFDAFDGGEVCTFDLHLLRDRSTGRLVVEVQYGEDGQRRVRLPLDVPADVTSFGVLAKVLAEEVEQ